MRLWRGCTVVASAILAVVLVTWPMPARAASAPLVLGTTVELERTGLLAVLIPLFEQVSGRQVTIVAVSGPQAIGLGMRGEVELLLVDVPDDERPFMAGGYGVDRRLVFYDDYVIVGPPGDPAGLGAAPDERTVMSRVARSGAPWLSRGDNSGPYQLEKRLWREAGVEPLGMAWYDLARQSMVPTILAANERQAYALTDRLTYLTVRDRVDLAIAAERLPLLLNLYHAIVVSPARGAWLDEAGARVLADFLTSPAAQELIARFGVEAYGQLVFTPAAGQVETDLVPVSSR